MSSLYYVSVGRTEASHAAAAGVDYQPRGLSLCIRQIIRQWAGAASAADRCPVSESMWLSDSHTDTLQY